MSEMITGTIKYVFFRSADGRFSIADVKLSGDSSIDGSSKIKIKGTDLPETTSLAYNFYGTWEEHKTYGKSFNVQSYEPVRPDKKNAIIEYLSSGLFRSIGPKMAIKIYDTFGTEAISVVEDDTDKLISVKGLSSKKIETIKECVKKTRYLQTMIKDLAQYGITIEQCGRLAKYHQDRALDLVHENPYILIKEARMSFKDADETALKMGVDSNSEVRLAAAFRHIMLKAYAEGNTGIELQTFGNKVYTLLQGTASTTIINELCIKYITEKRYRIVTLDFDGTPKKYLFTQKMFEIEQNVARNIERLKAAKFNNKKNIDIEEVIRREEREKGFIFDEKQKEAIRMACTTGFVVITGGPGTGKTSITDVICKVADENDAEICLLAPTGRAARKLAESTGREAYTAHSKLGIYNIDEDAENDELEEIKAGMLIIDEFSMVDINLAALLFEHISGDTPTVIVGDIDQLPSVGPGAVLRDIIESGYVPVIKLDHVFRAGEDSRIKKNATRINEGTCVMLTDDEVDCDFNMFRAKNNEEAKEKMTTLFLRRQREYGLANTMMLIPFKEGIGGVYDMNTSIQAIVNPPAEGKNETHCGRYIFREGDPVMHVNCNTPEASNGDLGTIVKINNDKSNFYVLVNMNGAQLMYEKDELENLTLAYAMTVHKSQGSESKAIITCMTTSCPPVLRFRAIPYVAISRGRDVVDVVYDDAWNQAIKTIRVDKRLSLLPYFLKRQKGEFVSVA